ncbi:hypothetical protein [Methanimicrococcus hongohii]|uniref:hypothetical protein n=1 Tax=Methanimicrococcus hongohii TaxID=3028295 RepID=UPI00292FFAD6|nr:hypothetical protein [Methanimicrococcus sp. Hf6]
MRLGGFFLIRYEILKPAGFNCFYDSGKVPFLRLSFTAAAPAKRNSLQLSFNVAAANQVYVCTVGQVCISACICSFFRNPLALNFARFAHKISGCCERKCLFAAGGRFPFPLASQVSVSACRSGLHCSRCCRQPQQLTAAARELHKF